MFSFLTNPNLQKVKQSALEIFQIIEQSGENPNEVLRRYAQQRNLNSNFQQRIVEEFNVLTFLEKLKNGTQHEHYVLMFPVIDECEKILKRPMSSSLPEHKSTEKSKMKKTASINDTYSNEYFGAEYFEYEDTNGIGNFDNFSYDSSVNEIFDDELLEKKAFIQKTELAKVKEDELIKQAMYEVDYELDNVMSAITKIANITPGTAKLVVTDLVKSAEYTEGAEYVLEECKHKPIDVYQSSIYEDLDRQDLNKIAGLGSLLSKLKKLLKKKKEIEKIRQAVPASDAIFKTYQENNGMHDIDSLKDFSAFIESDK